MATFELPMFFNN